MSTAHALPEEIAVGDFKASLAQADHEFERNLYDSESAVLKLLEESRGHIVHWDGSSDIFVGLNLLMQGYKRLDKAGSLSPHLLVVDTGHTFEMSGAAAFTAIYTVERMKRFIAEWELNIRLLLGDTETLTQYAPTEGVVLSELTSVACRVEGTIIPAKFSSMTNVLSSWTSSSVNTYKAKCIQGELDCFVDLRDVASLSFRGEFRKVVYTQNTVLLV